MAPFQLVGAIHERLVAARRVRALAQQLISLIPERASTLDVGCGDGILARLISAERHDISIRGIDVLVRPSAHICVVHFDGITIPYSDDSFDVVMLIDVLHHTPDPLVLLREARRVARTVILKDHFSGSFLSHTTLRFMDWVGNAPHGVALPYNYWAEEQWSKAFAEEGFDVTEIRTKLGLYPWPASWFFGRGLHFVARLDRSVHWARRSGSVQR